jgi:trimeric autotransporter adhesin
MSQLLNSTSGGGGGSIITIDGDSGSITGSTVTIYAANNFSNCGSSVKFVNSGTISTLYVTDSNGNTMIGNTAGNSSPGTGNTFVGTGGAGGGITSGTLNAGLGDQAGASLSSGSYNSAFGSISLTQLTTGSYNTMLGEYSGQSYTSSESSNICIGSQVSGPTGISNQLNIGAGTGTGNGQLSTAFISGINGNTVSNTLMVTINSSTDQLGVASIPSSSELTFDCDASTSATSSGGVITFNANSQAGESVSFTGSGSTVSLNTTDANFNIFIGLGCGNPVNGTVNLGIGYNALSTASVDGGSNVALGYYSLHNLSSGFGGNMAIGSASCAYLTSGAGNCCVGTSSLNNLVSGSYNVALGYGAGANYLSNESNNIVLNAYATAIAGEQNTCRIGDGTGSSGQQLAQTFICGIDGVALTTANVVTEVSNQLGTAVLTAGTNITIDSTSTPNQIIFNASGGGSGIVTIDGDSGSVTGSTVSLLASSGSANAGASIKFIASSATEMDLQVTDSNLNTYMGQSCGTTAATVGNTAFGYNNFPVVTTADAGGNVACGRINLVNYTGGSLGANSALGQLCLYSLTTGGANMAIGSNALDNLLTGNYNAAIGFNAGGPNYTSSESNNISINASTSTVTGESNVCRIGNGTGSGNQQLAQTFISGINGVSVAGPITNISSGDQLGVATLTSDVSGRVTNANQPAFSVYLNSPTGAVTGSGTLYTVIFDTTSFDQGTNFNLGSGTFTVPISGIYNFSFTVLTQGLVVGNTSIQLFIFKNGSSSYSGYYTNPYPLSVSGLYAATINTLIQCAASDAITFALLVGGNASDNVNLYGYAFNTNFTYASGYLVC